MNTCIQTLGILAITATLSFGEDAPKGGKEHKRPDPAAAFAKLDKDSNGSLSLEEFKASPRGQRDPVKAEGIFKKLDADGNDGVSLEEFKARGPARDGKKGKGKKKGGVAQ